MNWLSFFALSAIFMAVQSLPAGSNDEIKKTEQPSRPKVLVKRSKELLMFGNQQSHQATGNADASSSSTKNIAPSLEKRTLSNSGLEDVISEAEKHEQQQQADNRPKALPSTYVMDQPENMPSQHEKNYEYGRVLVNELDDVLPRGPWDLGRYYGGYSAEDRRKRSGGSSSSVSTSSLSSSPSSSVPTSSTAAPASKTSSSSTSQISFSQPKRSIPSLYYQEPRYKRESDVVDPDKQLYALLASYYNNEHRNRGNWRNYGNDEYENVDDDSNLVGLEDEDLNSSWMENSIPYQQPPYLSAEPLLNSELSALSGRGRPLVGYYDQYMNQYGAGASGQQYETGAPQYGTPQYGIPYNMHNSYYPPEKRFMVSRKRSQNYDAYGGRMVNTRSYPGYQHRLLY